MTATTTPRDTKKYQSNDILAVPQKGSTKVLKGTLVAAQAGYARPGVTATGLIALGRATKTSDNTSGADGAAKVEVEAGIFRWANGDGIAQADVGKSAWIVDNQTVSKASTGKSKAGLIVGVDSAGVWVATFPNMADQDSVELASLVTDLASTDTGKGTALIGSEDPTGRYAGTTSEAQLQDVGGRILLAVADTTALQAISAAARANNPIVLKLDTGTIWTFASGSSASASDWVIVPGAGTGRWIRNHVSLADLTTLKVPGMQAVNATLASGTVTINTGITVAAGSEVVPQFIGDITGTTNLAGLREVKASRVNGAPGVGTIVVTAVGDDGLIDSDAAGAIRVLIFAPQ